MTVNDGGPAFPVQDAASWQAHGITLRDYFAAHASEYDIAFWQNSPPNMKTCVGSDGLEYQAGKVWTREEARYLYADEMLKARGS